MRLMTRIAGAFTRPVRDYLDALNRFPAGPGMLDLAWTLAGFVAAWWIYVPMHELLHVAGCRWTGCSVSTLELAPEYGAAWLQKIFPFIQVGSEYAGRLSGFDTRGSDLRYLATVYLPFVLTITVGVPVLQQCARRRVSSRITHALLTGASLPVAYAGFISVTGDFYELGSILVSRLAVALGAGGPVERWRSDDLPLLVATMEDGGALDWAVIGSSLLLGVVLIFATYSLGTATGRLYRRIRRSPVE